MDYEYRSVPSNEIETNNRTFQITTDEQVAELALSISTMGLLHPVVLFPRKDRYLVVSGFRRLAACAERSITRIPARILSRDTPLLACAQFAIADNSSQRPLNVVEQARAYQLIHQFAENAQNEWETIAATGLPHSRAAMARIRSIVDMPSSMQSAILEGSIAIPVAMQIHQLQAKDADALCRFFQKIGASLSMQREFLAMITDISHRDDVPIRRLLKDEDVLFLTTDDQCPGPQKINTLRRFFKAKRFPALDDAENQFWKKVKSLHLNSHLQIHPPRFFEGKTYRIVLSVSSKKQLRSMQSELDKLIHHPDILPD